MMITKEILLEELTTKVDTIQQIILDKEVYDFVEYDDCTNELVLRFTTRLKDEKGIEQDITVNGTTNIPIDEIFCGWSKIEIVRRAVYTTKMNQIHLTLREDDYNNIRNTLGAVSDVLYDNDDTALAKRLANIIEALENAVTATTDIDGRTLLKK